MANAGVAGGAEEAGDGLDVGALPVCLDIGAGGEVAHIIAGGEYQGIEAAQFSRGQIIRHIVQAQEFQLGQWRAAASRLRPAMPT